MGRTFKNILWIFVSIVLGKCIGMATSLLIPRILGPANFGIWIIMLLVVQYAPIACFGTVEALLKLFPYYAARGDADRAKGVEEGVFGSIIIGSVLCLLLGLAFPLAVALEVFQSVEPLVRVMVIAASLSLFSAFFSFRLIAHQHFKMVGLTDTFRSLSGLVFLVSFSYVWGLNGSAFGYLMSECIVCTLLAVVSTKACGKIGAKFSRNLLLELIRVGFPITIVWWIYILQTSAGSLISMTFLGATATGYLGFGVSITSILVLIPDAINRVLYPRINEEVGKNRNPENMQQLVVIPGLIMSLMFAILIGFLVFVLPVFYNTFFERYRPGLLCGQILVFGAFFSCLLRSGANFLIAKDKQNLVLKHVLIGTGANVISNVFFVKMGLGVEGVALGIAVSSGLMTTLVWRSVFKTMGCDNREQWKGLINLYEPFFLTLFIIMGMAVFLKGVMKENGILIIPHFCLFSSIFLAISLIVPSFRRRSKEVFRTIKMNVRNKVAVE